jgi:hypothetical protein
MVPDEVAATLTPDLVAIIGHLTAQASPASQPGITAWILMAEDNHGDLTALGPVFTDADVQALRELAEDRGWIIRPSAPLVSKDEFTRRAS